MDREEYEAWAERRALDKRRHRRGAAPNQYRKWPQYLVNLAIEKELYRRQSRLSFLGWDPIYRQPGLRVLAVDMESGWMAWFRDLEQVGDLDFSIDKVVFSIERRNGIYRYQKLIPDLKIEAGWKYRGLYWFYENPMGGLI